jgi:hypothetical protein
MDGAFVAVGGVGAAAIVFVYVPCRCFEDRHVVELEYRGGFAGTREIRRSPSEAARSEVRDCSGSLMGYREHFTRTTALFCRAVGV